MSSPSRRSDPQVTRFESAKSTEVIIARNRSVLDTLIIASLDPEVRAIAPAEAISITLNGLVIQHVPDCCLVFDGRSIVVDVYRQPRSAARGRFEAVEAAHATQGVAYECREPPTVFGSPLLMNSRAVWAARGFRFRPPIK